MFYVWYHISSNMIRLFFAFLGLGSISLALGQSNTVGVLLQTPSSFDGYTLMPVTSSGNTYLIDNCGQVVQSWTSNYNAGMMAYLRDDGCLVRAGRTGNPNFGAGGVGGIIEMFDWDGDLKWSYLMSNDSICQHHDLALLPSGHILALAWKAYDASVWIAHGRDPDLTASVVWGTYIVELNPLADPGEEIVWEWEALDHLVQDFDPALPNFASVSTAPGQLDVNYQAGENDKDWLHTNSIAYNAELDQILISSRDFNELWVIDHDVPADLVSGPAGHLMYRWGNPEAYGRGTEEDRVFHSQHDARWNADGQMMVFSNGNERPEGMYSTVELLTPPLLPNGTYNINPELAFGPTTTDRTYPPTLDADFFSQNTSGAQQLPNGNLLITEGAKGALREVNPNDEVVWSYVNPVGIFGATAQFGNPVSNGVFKVERYSSEHPALINQDLQGMGVLEITNEPPLCELYPASYCAGDLNGDFVVAVGDLLVFLGYFGCASNCDGDFNGNGTVDVGDLLAFLENLGSTCTP